MPYTSEWQEELHPRDDIGRFTAGGGSGSETVKREWGVGEKTLSAVATARGLKVQDVKDVNPRLKNYMAENMMFVDEGTLSPAQVAGVEASLSDIPPNIMQALRDENVTITGAKLTPMGVGAVTFIPLEDRIPGEPLHIFVNTDIYKGDVTPHATIATQRASQYHDSDAFDRELTRGILTHEIGHCVDSLAGDRYSAAFSMVTAPMEQPQLIRFLSGLDRNLSTYATTSPSEAVAELFSAAIYDVDVPDALIKDLGKLMMTGLGMKKKS